MQLESFKSTKAKNLSGGNKRKLCVSNALIGAPDLQVNNNLFHDHN